jgi:hypothetical protein
MPEYTATHAPQKMFAQAFFGIIRCNMGIAGNIGFAGVVVLKEVESGNWDIDGGKHRSGAGSGSPDRLGGSEECCQSAE